MRFIPTKVHGILDYITGIVLITAPWMFGFTDIARTGSSAQNLVPIFLGIAAILYSLFTDYEFGVSRKLSMRTHLLLDLMSGILLAASPWLFGFADNVYMPHLILGIFEIGASLLTRQQPEHTAPGGAYKTAHTV